MSDLAALQAALAAEEATIYGYGVVGAKLRGADRSYATNVLAIHMNVRDQLMALISAAGARPGAARAAYALPNPVTDPTAARQLAAHLEQSSAGALWDLIAASPPQSPTRALTIGWLGEAAVRAAHWGAQQALPGQPT
jgi:hypothetical protein